MMPGLIIRVLHLARTRSALRNKSYRDNPLDSVIEALIADTMCEER